MNRRLKAACIHLLGSASIALVAGMFVFSFWYPTPYAQLAGGLNLFSMLVSIDVVLGPCLTAVIASQKKSYLELQRDVACIVFVQMIAFGYGVYTIANVRPVHLVFEVDRFVVVTANDIDPVELNKAKEMLQHLPWTGPTTLGTRKAANPEEKIRSIEKAMQGQDVSMQPERWIDYSESVTAVLSASREVGILLQKYPQMRSIVQEISTNKGVELKGLYFLPLVTRRDDWVVLIAGPDARIVGFLKADGFF